MVKEIDVKPDFSCEEIDLGVIHKCVFQASLKDLIAEERLKREEAIQFLELMLLIRAFEEMVVDLRAGRFVPKEGFQFIGATHLSIGQEAVAVGAISAIKPTDYITSTHRGHGHAIAKGAYFIYNMTDEELCQFLGIQRKGETREELLDRAMNLHLYKTMAELLGKEDGYCRGRGGGMHIAQMEFYHLGANAIVGGSMALATGAAISVQKQKTGQIVLCIVGDGAVNNGIFNESVNMACMAQFKTGIPIIYLIENNQYGMTGQAIGEVTGVDYLARRAAGYNLKNLHAEIVDGMDVLAVWDAVKRAGEKARKGEGPVLLDCLTYRYMGHSLSDDGTKYRSDEEVAFWKSRDAIDRYKEKLIEAGLMTLEEIEVLENKAKEKIKEATVKAANAADPDPNGIYDGLYSDSTSEGIGDELRTVEYRAERVRRFPRDKEGKIMYRHAVLEALIEEMIRDRRVIVYGEDVADYGGAFQVTHGLLDIFGRERVFNTAISEAAIAGSAIGMAMTGLRPVAEIMYIDFILMAMDQVGNQAAKTKYMFGGKAVIPMVIRTTIGGGRGYAGQHSQSLEAVVAHFPGLKIAVPGTAYDAKGLLKTAIRDDNPVIFIEHQTLYTEKGVVPEEDYTIPFGVANILLEGADLTIVAYSYMVSVALKAAEQLKKEGIDVEIVDPRTLYPLDVDTIVNSVKKTGRAVILNQAPEIGCFGEHIAYQIQKNALSYLKAPIQIVAAHNVPPPMAQTLERENIPSPEKVAKTAREMLGEKKKYD